MIKTDRIELKYLLGLLNSRLISFWLYYKGKLQGNLYQIDYIPIIKIPRKGFIKGIVRNVFDDTMTLEYGIEQYFFERNAEFEMQNLTVAVKVSNSGRAKISELLQNGKPIVMKYEKIKLTS